MLSQARMLYLVTSFHVSMEGNREGDKRWKRNWEEGQSTDPKVNSPSISLYFLFALYLARYQAICVILGESLSFGGTYFLHLKEYDPHVSSRPGQKSPCSLLFWELIMDTSHWLNEFSHSQGLIHDIKACINANNLVSLWKAMRVQMDFPGPIWALHPANQVSHI